MEWVETTGRTVEEAKEAALDELGVDESDAEFEVVEEARMGLFGRVRSEARVRARVRPTTPRPKDDRRDRRRRTGQRRSRSDAVDDSSQSSGVAAEAKGSGDRPNGGTGAPEEARPTDARGAGASRSRQGPKGEETKAGPKARETKAQERGETPVAVELGVEERLELAREFVAGVAEEFGFHASVEAAVAEVDGTLEVRVWGADLGLLIGPRGTTLAALQELTRTVVQRRAGGTGDRITVDVAGYAQRRREALERFARQLADEVRSSGVRKVLEPMSASDRKVVHDAVTGIEGVQTTSEGEEPRRRVVILPDAPAS